MTLPPFCHCPMNSILHGKPKKNNIFLYNVFSVSSCSMRTGHALPKSKPKWSPEYILGDEESQGCPCRRSVPHFW